MTFRLPTPGSIGLVHVDGLAGHAIEIADFLNGDGWEDYEHAFVFEGGTSLNDATVIEAEPGGARRALLSEYRGRKVLWLPCPPEFSAAVVAAAVKYLGTPYSGMDFIDIAAYRFDFPLEVFIKDYVEDSKHIICSVMSDQAAMNGGWFIFPVDTYPGYVTPGHLSKMAPKGSVPELIG